MKKQGFRMVKLAACLVCLALALSISPASNVFALPAPNCEDGHCCIPPGGIDDTLYRTDCCSGSAVPGSTYCINPADWGTTWASCSQICA